MPRFTVETLRTLYTDIEMWAEKVEEMEKLSESSTGETKQAYALVYKDFLWKLQRAIGQLWFYVCGVDEMNPFEINQQSSE